MKFLVLALLMAFNCQAAMAQSAYSARKDSIKAASRIAAAQKADSIARTVGDSTKAIIATNNILRIRKENDSLFASEMQRVMLMDSLAALGTDAEGMLMDSLARLKNDSTELLLDSAEQLLDSAEKAVGDKLPLIGNEETANKAPRDWSSWRPNPQKALWMALVIPGGGQIYNRKYWKLPIIYGGIVGCVYAMSWNNMMYKDYSQAYLDIMDSDPNTQSYNKFLHLGKQIDSSNEDRYKKIFKSRKDRYRRWRDLSFFCLIGVYAISVIDAYVDAELSQFDISDDLSMRVQPAVVGATPQNGFTGESSIGVNCTLNF